MSKRVGTLISLLNIIAAILSLFLTKIERSNNLGLYYLFSKDILNLEYAIREVTVPVLLFGALLIIISLVLALDVLNLVKIVITVRKHKIFDTSDTKYIWILNTVLLCLVTLNIGFIIPRVMAECAIPENIMEVREILWNQKTVIHAGGDVNINGIDYNYTNSLDAINSCYDAGNKVAEIDFMMTSDYKLVCAHDGDESWAAGSDFKYVPTEDEFKNSKVFGALTPMSLDDLADFMRQHADFYVVTDIKDGNIPGCKFIMDQCPDLADRFIIQIYYPDEYEPIHTMGFRNIIYTLYRTSDELREPDTLRKDVTCMDLVGVTFWDDWKDSIVPILKDSQVLFFVHTVNDPEEMKEFIDDGVLIYTDNVDNDWLR